MAIEKESTVGALSLIHSLLLVGVVAASSAQAQENSPTALAFEEASIKLSPPDHGYMSIGEFPSNRFTARNVSIDLLIAMAFGVDSRFVTGLPKRSESSFYDINAVTDGEELTQMQMQPLLRSLLERRFHLSTRLKGSVEPGFNLVVAKRGAKLQPNRGAPPLGYILTNGLQLHHATAKTLASMLASPSGRPVADKTGIDGLYDFDLRFAPTATADSSLPDLFTALQEQLGLKLEPAKVPVQILVVDHVDETPTAN